MDEKQITKLKDTDILKGIILDEYIDEKIYTKKKKLVGIKKKGNK